MARALSGVFPTAGMGGVPPLAKNLLIFPLPGKIPLQCTPSTPHLPIFCPPYQSLISPTKQSSEWSKSLFVRFPPPNKKMLPAKFIIPLHWGKGFSPYLVNLFGKLCPSSFRSLNKISSPTKEQFPCSLIRQKITSLLWFELKDWKL